jgi:hypothetical protein
MNSGVVLQDGQSNLKEKRGGRIVNLKQKKTAMREEHL